MSVDLYYKDPNDGISYSVFNATSTNMFTFVRNIINDLTEEIDLIAEERGKDVADLASGKAQGYADILEDNIAQYDQLTKKLTHYLHHWQMLHDDNRVGPDLPILSVLASSLTYVGNRDDRYEGSIIRCAIEQLRYIGEVPVHIS